jgi:hypothetical protein
MIQIFAELYWSIQRPSLNFYLNNKKLIHDLRIIESMNFIEYAVFDIDAQCQDNDNKLTIELINKTDTLVTNQSDHWVSIKEIAIDGIFLDSDFVEDSVFVHGMDDSWVRDMRLKGIFIQDSYKPGNDLRLNGVCHINLPQSALDSRLLKLWKLDV